MQIRRRLIAALCAVMLVCAMSVTAYAHQVPDAARTGSIEIAMAQDGTKVPGGTLTLYRVGQVREDDGNYSFALTGEFTESGVSLEDVQADELAGELARYAEDNGLSGQTLSIFEGAVTFSDLELGLYLLVQEEAAPGYNAIVPFLVSIPTLEDGVYRYDVNANPKVELIDVPLEPVDPGDTSEPGDTSAPADSSDPGDSSAPASSASAAAPTLPQTGQLNWPVPVLAALGLALFALGWMLRLGKKGGYEK